MSSTIVRRVRVHAPAKVNLTLRVLGLRSDGYHAVRTALQSLALRDTVTVTAVRGECAIECDDPACPSDRSNLVWRAAERLWRSVGRPGEPTGVRLHIAKRIPLQAGLGGGSSDAAAALRALAVLWRVRVPEESMRGIARELGADVPYFLLGGTALGLDRGDVLVPMPDRPRAWVVLVVPGFGVSTADAYRWWDRDAGTSRVDADASNDLQGPVAARHPEIARLVGRLTRLGAVLAAMSGSGSAVFGVFDDAQRAEAAARAVSGRRRTVHLTWTLSQPQYAGLTRPRLQTTAT